jgi:hypothetical protein
LHGGILARQSPERNFSAAAVATADAGGKSVNEVAAANVYAQLNSVDK